MERSKSECSCKGCHSIVNGFFCLKCFTAEYCSKACRKKDSKRHSRKCETFKEGTIALPDHFLFRIRNRTRIEEELFLNWNFTHYLLNAVLRKEMTNIIRTVQCLIKIGTSKDRNEDVPCDVIICRMAPNSRVTITNHKPDPFCSDCDYCMQLKVAQEICERKKDLVVMVILNQKRVFYRRLHFPSIFEIEEDKNKKLCELDFEKYIDLSSHIDLERFCYMLKWLNSSEQLQMNCRIVLAHQKTEPLYMKIFDAKHDSEMLDPDDQYEKEFVEVAAERFQKRLVGGAAFSDIEGNIHSSCTYYITDDRNVMKVAFMIVEEEITDTTGYQRLCNFFINRAREMNCKTICTSIIPHFQHIYFLRAMGFTLNLNDPEIDLYLDSTIDVYKLGFSRCDFHTSPRFAELIGSKSVHFDGLRMTMFMKV